MLSGEKGCVSRAEVPVLEALGWAVVVASTCQASAMQGGSSWPCEVLASIGWELLLNSCASISVRST